MSQPFVAVPSWERDRPPAGEPAGAGGTPGTVVGDASRPDAPYPLPPVHVPPPVPPMPGAAPAAPAPSDPAARRPRESPRGVAETAPHPDLALLDGLAPYAHGATDLFVNGGAGLWADRGEGAEPVPGWSASEAEVRELAVRLVARGGRHVDEANPAVDVRLGRGIRVHVVLPPIATAGTLVSVRIPRGGSRSLGALLHGEAIRPDPVALAVEARLRRAVRARENLLVTGAGGTGKTTLLAALLAEASARERIVVVEDVAELVVDHPHVVGLEARQANLEGAGRIGLDALVREALRMRPDRIVVGECRGPELRELLGALNTGHDGGAGTLHANSLADVPARLEALGAAAGMTPGMLARQAVSAIDLVVHLERADGVRRIAAIGRLEDRGGSLVATEEALA